MAECAAAPAGGGFVSSVTTFVDCQAQVLGTGAWQALAAPNSTLAVVLTGFLTLFIALIGYRLLLGSSVTIREGTLAFVKIGAVFALATSWPAYRTLVYDVVVDGPGQLVSEIGPHATIVGSDGTLLQRLDLTDRALAQLAILGSGPPPAASSITVPPPPFGGFDAFAFGGSRILFLLTAIAGLMTVRVVAGLMLALGPFFIAFLLFDSTRSLFEGWVRVLAGAALAAIGVSLTLGLELALLDPWLSGVLARRMAGESLPTIATELFVVVSLFTIIVIAALYGCIRVARAFRLPSWSRLVVSTPEAADRLTQGPRSIPEQTRPSEAERTRAAAIANLLVATNRRESANFHSDLRIPLEARRASVPGRDADPTSAPMPVGRTYMRRTGSRVSARAAKRDTNR